jgi:polyhydroxyalkanoate synthesis regulator phasin
MRTAIVAVAAIAVVAAILYRDAQQGARVERLTEQVAELSHAPGLAPVQVRPLSPLSPGVDVDSLAARLAERIKPVAAAESRSPRDSAAPSLPNHEQAAALDSVGRILDSAIARGRLTREDTRQLQRELMAAQRPAESEELFRQLSVAINTGKLVVEGPLLAQEP